MASKTRNINKIWSLFLVFAVMLVSRGGRAQSGCSNNMIGGLSSCISYLRGNSSRPLPSCCTSLANVERSQPECLCPVTLSNIGASFTVAIALNRTLAMALPSTCKLRTPHCDDVANGPAAASSPEVSPPSPPSGDSSPDSMDPAATPPISDFPSGSKPVLDNASASTTRIYLKTLLTLSMAAWIVATFH